MFIEELNHFFNADEFAVTASIHGMPIKGILESLLSIIHQVQCVQFRFTCAQVAIPSVKLDDEVRIGDQHYRIVEIKSDGTGLAYLLLETTL